MNLRGTAFASDYDGTLCHSNWDTGAEWFDPAVLAAVRSYQDAGGLFGICTGRPLFSVEQGVRGYVDLDFYIVTTGAQVLDRSKRILFERTLDKKVARELCERYSEEGMGFLAVTDRDFYSVGRDFAPQMRTVPTIDDADGKLLGVSLEYHGDEEAARKARDEMNSRYAGVAEGFQNLGSVDVVPAGCSKGSAVRVLHENLGIDCVVGIGDSYNDLPLLAAADVSYTFHSSPQEVRDAATYVVEDLAEAIEHFMTLEK